MRLVLVDDEKGIVAGLRKLIHRHLPECEVVDSAYNGVDGFRLIERYRPDMVITDIRMPQADGLEMIGKAKEAGIPTQFILLSGYADFEYARAAMQMGVRFYLNKPVEEEELQECVNRVMDTIREDRAKRQEVDELKRTVRSRDQAETLRLILEGGGEREGLAEELLRPDGLSPEDCRFACLLIEADGEGEVLRESVLQPIFGHIDAAFGAYRRVYRLRYSNDRIAALVVQDGSIDEKDLLLAVRRLLEQAKSELNRSLSVGIGTVRSRAEGIGESFEEAREALGLKVSGEQGDIRPFSGLHPFPKKRDLIAEIKEYVAAHCQEPLSLADLSTRFFLSPIYLSQLFKQKTGETYMSYLARVRIDKAKQLLEKTDWKVYEICQQVGYSDTQYFARLFEKQTGWKPSEYRRRQTEG
jgi:Response regulator containing CheY-like receiver domain and AraC-type DNA-binding domain